MSNPKGTPKTLMETLQHARTQIHELCDQERLVNADLVILETFIRDYLSQQFGAAMLKTANTPTEKELTELWQKIMAA